MTAKRKERDGSVTMEPKKNSNRITLGKISKYSGLNEMVQKRLIELQAEVCMRLKPKQKCAHKSKSSL